jgi:hypothetical protein
LLDRLRRESSRLGARGVSLQFPVNRHLKALGLLVCSLVGEIKVCVFAIRINGSQVNRAGRIHLGPEVAKKRFRAADAPPSGPLAVTRNKDDAPIAGRPDNRPGVRCILGVRHVAQVRTLIVETIVVDVVGQRVSG